MEALGMLKCSCYSQDFFDRPAIVMKESHEFLYGFFVSYNDGKAASRSLQLLPRRDREIPA